MKTKGAKKKTEKKPPLRPLPFLQQLLVHLPDLPEKALNRGEPLEPLFHLRLQVLRDGDLANPALALPHGQNPDGAMPFPALLATAEVGLFAAHHPAHSRSGYSVDGVGRRLYTDLR